MTKKEKIEKNREEFESDPNCYVIFATNGLKMGRNITNLSRSQYCKEHQGDLVIFNANVITREHGKVWYGDLNVNEDFDNLKNVADQIEEDLYILMEGDARFGYEKQPISVLISKARTIIKCNSCKRKEPSAAEKQKLDKRYTRKYNKKN
jgi:hypothetical protein